VRRPLSRRRLAAALAERSRREALLARKIAAAELSAVSARACNVARPPAITVLAVKAMALRGRFASLDRSARRWRLVSKSRW
jgi:hypothetical protein